MAAATGLAEEHLWPYTTSKFRAKPSLWSFADAKRHRVLRYERMLPSQGRIVLAGGNPWVFGVPIWESFESDQAAATGLVPMPGANEKSLGGHCMAAFGYDDEKVLFPGLEPGAFLIRNSWGLWGLDGYCWMPYKYLLDWATDCWVILNLALEG